MNTSRITMSRSAGAGVLALLLTGATPALADTADVQEGHTAVVRVLDDAGGEGHVLMLTGEEGTGTNGLTVAGDHRMHAVTVGDGHSIEVRVVNGETTVVVDGEEVPNSRVIQKDDAIVILDDNGDEIRTIDIGPRGADRSFGLHMGDDDHALWFGDAPGDAMLPAPKVMMGVQLGEPSPALERHLELEPGTTTLITGLYAGLPAHAAGIEEFDVITSIDGRTPANPAALRQALAALEPGDTVRLGVINRGSAKTVRVEVAAYDREAMRNAEVIGDVRAPALFGSKFFGRTVPGDDSLFELDFGNVKDLNRFFLDDSNGLYELPNGRMRMWVGEPDGEGATETEVDVELDSKLSTLDKRLAALEEMLDALLKEAKKE